MSENMGNSTKLPNWFTVVAVMALIWNLMGVMAFISGQTMTAEQLAALSEAEQNLHQTTPLWATIAFACAVFCGALGCLFLALKKAVAKNLLMVSLGAIIVQMFHAFFISNSYEVFGPGGAVMPVMVIIIAFLLVMLSNKAVKQGWIN
ncbi:hypothetical protein [Thalassotalea sp. ND16A]|uniref:hypothetical protein n=1 Tax=Thalassotalea sp. ND16A TaxID=1535422 RepID=UPI00051CE785|nr:hypothetical protein [Thalassotalea sp. ND16A]KGJ95787.1 hypothetical protein ND16A_1322 [Thalassotalea sp. ND16A]